MDELTDKQTNRWTGQKHINYASSIIISVKVMYCDSHVGIGLYVIIAAPFTVVAFNSPGGQC